MKSILTTALLCSLFSLLGIVTLTTITVVPGREKWLNGMILADTVFLIAWLLLAAWAWWKLRMDAGVVTPHKWLSRTILIVGAAYVVLVILLTFG